MRYATPERKRAAINERKRRRYIRSQKYATTTYLPQVS